MTYKQSITISDIQMNIITEEEPAVIEAIAGEIDRRIRDIFLKSQNRCPKIEAALLCAIAYCADKNRLSEEIAELEKELRGVDVNAMLEELDAIKAEKADLASKLEYTEDQARTMKHGIDIANDQIRLLKDQIEASAEKLAAAEAEAEALKAEIEEMKAELLDAQVKIEIFEEPSEEEPVAEKVESLNIVNEIVAETACEEPVEDVAVEATEEASESVEEAPEAEEIVAVAIEDNIAENFTKEVKAQKRSSVDENQITIDTEGEIAEKKNESSLEKEKNKAHKRVRAMFDLITFENV